MNDKSIKDCLRAAENGNAEAQFDIGCYYNGQYYNGEDGQKQAFEWFLKAAEQGHYMAQFNIGAAFTHGEGVERDPIKAYEWYLKSAEQGCKPAQYRIDFLNENGYHQNPQKALEMLDIAASNGEV